VAVYGGLCLSNETSAPRDAVRQHPELAGTYLNLRAAELAARALRDPEDQRWFVAQVSWRAGRRHRAGRTAAADTPARTRSAESREGPRIPQSRVTRRESRLR